MQPVEKSIAQPKRIPELASPSFCLRKKQRKKEERAYMVKGEKMRLTRKETVRCNGRRRNTHHDGLERAGLCPTRRCLAGGTRSPDHFYRHLHKVLDLSFIYALVGKFYTGVGRPSVDPVVFFKLQLVMFFEEIRSERLLMRQVADRLSVRWYVGYDLDEPLPDHSTAAARFAPATAWRSDRALLRGYCGTVSSGKVDLGEGAVLRRDAS